ncbi:M48 family metallopeptidase [Luteibacter yeojuensis]|uniref:Metal-dependent hydrolase n=1 Tax=Luteibacter yeojuensis TaxID=345309 RepID=A0A0F3KW08_9GAMM|nr:YgjP-like metallopeptidase domain-containing protein [Luteibacter yeojuensis]KJV35346.1 metal-dependent hydrolase [Luteibacter yeojuensis]
MASEQGDWLELSTPTGGTIRVLKSAHPRARRLRLTVTPKGARLTYPNGTHVAQMTAFLRHHADWLEQKLGEFHMDAEPLPGLKVGVPTSFPFRGEETTLHWAEGPYPRVQHDENGITLVIPGPHHRELLVARGLLATFFEAQIRRDVSRWLPGYIPQINAAPTALRIRPLKSLWGSLDTRDRINLDLALALAPPAALRYVLVHELCHLKVRNHSPRFWHWVESILPEHKAQRTWLRAHGSGLKAQLDRLIADVAD